MQAVSRQSLVGGAGVHRLATPRSVLIGLQISRTLARGNLKKKTDIESNVNLGRTVHHVC